MDQSGRIPPRVPKPNASFPSGLTRPRLVKQRRRAPRAKPEEENGQTRIIGEKIGTWYPFDPPTSTKVPNGTDRSGYDSKGFVFGGNTSFPGSHLRSGAVGEEKGASFGFGRSSGDLGPGVFVFGNNGRRKEKKKKFTFNSRRSSSGNFGGVGFKLSEDAGKTRVSNTGTGVGLDRTNVGDSGSGVFGGSSFFSLPDQMRKLNIDKSSSDQWTGKNLGGRPKPDVHEKRPGTFISGKSFTMFGQTEYSNLPQKFRNLNVGSYDNGVGLGEADNHDACKTDFASEKIEFELHEGVKKVEETDVCSSDANRENSFAFGSRGKTVNSVDDGIANKLHEKIKKLNIDSSSLKNGESRNKDVDGAGDLFRSRTKKTDGPAQHTSFIKKSTFTELKDDTFNLNSRSSVCGPNTSEKVENGVPHSQDDVTDKFVFSYNDRSSCTNVRNGFHFTANEALFPGVDVKPVSDPDKNLKHNGSNIWNSTIPIFEFQAGSEGVKIDAGSSCFTSSDYCHMNNYAMAGLSSPSFVCPASSTADFTSIDNGVGTNAASKNASFSSEENIFTGSRHNSAFRAKKGDKESKSKKCSAKSRKGFPVHQRMGLASSDRGSSPKEKPELGSPESYSPMDFSPYDEILVPDTVPGSSVASDESAFDSHHVSINIQRSVSVEEVEDLVSASQHAVVNEGDRKCSKFHENDFKEESECFVDAKSSFFEGEEEDGEEVESRQKDDKISMENSSIYHSFHNHLTKDKISSSSSTMENQARDERPNFVFFSGKKDGLNDLNESSFTFSSSATTQDPFSSSKQSHRRKSQTRIAQKSHCSTISGKFNVDATTMNLPPHLNSSLQSETTWKFGNEGVSSISLKSLEEERVPSIKKQEVKQGAVPSTFSSTALSEECEKWRARGNQFYAKGNLLKAEEYYTCGVKCVSPSEGSRSCTHALMLCYSNRAAARMSLGRVREALSDCLLAIAIDPSFLKAQVRAANCHLALGETEDASKLYKKCFQLSEGDSSVSKILEEVSDGLQKSQKVAEYVVRSNELLQTKAHANLTTVLEMISEAMLISPQSESLIKMKAEALLLLRRYNEVIDLCEKTVKSSERNSHLVCADDPSKQEADNVRPFEIWRWHLISRSYFSSGRLEEALQLLQRLVGSISEKHGSKCLESFTSFSDTVREMLRLKAAGNTAFQGGRHSEAVEHYTAALACSIESRPYAAICFCNRAAAYQALSQITDAIADCSLAIALDANYLKAISRRATLCEMIRDYDQAKNDLSRLISLVQRQGEEKLRKFGATVRSSTPNRDILKNARVRLASVEEEARKGISLDVYKILGVESLCSAADIKKAYRKAALKHHPDKAGQLLVKGADDSVWGDVSHEVHRDADRLFKMIGEAYTVLSDPTKRMQYDEEEEIRTVVKKNEGMRHKYPGDCQYTRYDRSNSRRQTESPRKPYGTSHYRWSEAAYSSRHYS